MVRAGEKKRQGSPFAVSSAMTPSKTGCLQWPFSTAPVRTALYLNPVVFPYLLVKPLPHRIPAPDAKSAPRGGL